MSSLLRISLIPGTRDIPILKTWASTVGSLEFLIIGPSAPHSHALSWAWAWSTSLQNIALKAISPQRITTNRVTVSD